MMHFFFSFSLRICRSTNLSNELMLGLEEGNLISQFLDLELMLLIRLIRILLQMLKG
jgi:hypothetical protein